MTHCDGLILFLDAGNRTSYPGSGNIWYDLSGNDNHARGDPNRSGGGSDASRFPEWQNKDGGRFYFNGSRGLIVENDLGEHTESTHEAWIFRDNFNDSSRFICDSRNGGGSWCSTNSKEANIRVRKSFEYNYGEKYECDCTLFGQWNHVTITGDESETVMFIDGKRVPSETIDTIKPINWDLGSNFRIANRYNSTRRWHGYIGVYRIYDKKLTEEQVFNNYWKDKTRFQA